LQRDDREYGLHDHNETERFMIFCARLRFLLLQVGNMRLKQIWLMAVAGLALLVSASLTPALAQVGHPAKGSWLGYWGPNAATQRRLILALDWRDRAVVGQINPGPDAVPISRADIDYATWTMTIEAQMPAANGKKEKWVATGKLENLGSWTDRRYSGTYTFGAEHGEFKVALH
jgi:hypothetical protein